MTKILIVEDEMIIAADISLQLTNLGYEVSGITPRGEDALKNIESTRPDIVLMDIALKGEMDGVETAQAILDNYQIPVIFLTSNVDNATFQRAKATKPYGFIAKPFDPDDLQRAIELTLERIEEEQSSSTHSDNEPETNEISILNDRLFIRYKEELVKVFIKDILFVEADRAYCKLLTSEKEYILATPLSKIETQLPKLEFMRVHRSFVVNLTHIDAIADNHEYLKFSNRMIPISRRLRDEVVKRLRVV